MITTLLKLVKDLLHEYKTKGESVLVNCASVPAFQRLAEHLSKVTLEHIGLKEENFKDYFRKEATTYFNILEEQDFCVGVFCLSRGSSLNLHDHPNMLVLSKFLKGAIHHRSLDLIDRSYQVELPQRLMNDDDDSIDIFGKKLEAVVRAEKTLRDGDINYLTPDMANIHRYTALEDTVLLDILLPNYNEMDRNCNYYIEMPIEEDEEAMEIPMWNTGLMGQVQEKNSEQTLEQEFIVDKNAEGLLFGFKGMKLHKPGEKTTLIYSFPPLDEPITLVPYNGEKFEYEAPKIE